MALELKVKIGGDGTNFQHELGKAKLAAMDFGKTLSSGALPGFLKVGSFAAVAEGLREIVTGAIEFGTETKHSAEQFGLSTTEVQQLGKAARKTGLEFSDFGTALLKVESARKEAAEGNEALRGQFARLGVTLADLNNPALRHIDLLRKIAAASKDLDGAGRAALHDLLGKSGARLAGALELLPTITADQVVSPEAIERLDDIHKRMSKAATAVKGWTAEAVAYWDAFVQRNIEFLMNPTGNQNEVQGMTREQKAERNLEIDRNAGVRDEDMRGEQRLLLDYRNNPNPRRLSFDQFAGESDAASEKKLFQDKELAKSQEELNNLKQAGGMIGLSHEEKRAELTRRILQLEQDIAEARTAGFENAAVKGEVEVQRLKNELKQDKPDKALNLGSADRLARIGLFTGRGPSFNPAAAAASQRAQQLAATNKLIAETITSRQLIETAILGIPAQL